MDLFYKPLFRIYLEGQDLAAVLYFREPTSSDYSEA
jgi:hypothetical protein